MTKIPARRSRTVLGTKSIPTGEASARLAEFRAASKAYDEYHSKNTARPADPQTPEEEKAWMDIAEEFSPLTREEFLDDEHLPEWAALRAGLESLIHLIWNKPEGTRIEMELAGGDKVILIRRPRRSNKRAA